MSFPLEEADHTYLGLRRPFRDCFVPQSAVQRIKRDLHHSFCYSLLKDSTNVIFKSYSQISAKLLLAGWERVNATEADLTLIKSIIYNHNIYLKESFNLRHNFIKDFK